MGRAILFIVTGFIIIFGIIQRSVQNHQKTLAKRSPNYYYAEQSRNIAFSLMEVAVGKFNDNKYWTPPNSSYKLMNGQGTIHIDSSKAFGSRFYLTIKGEIDSPFTGKKAVTTIKATANRPAFSIYSYFTDEEPQIYFGSSDTLNGPVHTNGQFHIQGEPVFNGKVSSPNEPYEQYGANPHYLEGKDFHADPIELPKDLADLSKAAKDGGLHYDDDKIKVEFSVNSDGNGMAAITKYQQGRCKDYHFDYQSYQYVCDQYEESQIGSTEHHNLQASNFNGVISSSGAIEVKGTLKGNITVHSKSDIHIAGDVTYEDYDPTNPTKKLSSDNLLGLVSQGNVYVDEGAEADRSTKDVNITASIMAMGSSFKVQNFRNGGPRGQLRILGGIIQKTRGAVAGVDRYGNISSGYSKLYTYDERLRTNSTPDFPTVKRFKITSWRESTRKEDKN